MTIEIFHNAKIQEQRYLINTDDCKVMLYHNLEADCFELSVMFIYDKSINRFRADSFSEIAKYLDSVCGIEVPFTIGENL